MQNSMKLAPVLTYKPIAANNAPAYISIVFRINRQNINYTGAAYEN